MLSAVNCLGMGDDSKVIVKKSHKENRGLSLTNFVVRFSQICENSVSFTNGKIKVISTKNNSLSSRGHGRNVSQTKRQTSKSLKPKVKKNHNVEFNKLKGLMSALKQNYAWYAQIRTIRQLLITQT